MKPVYCLILVSTIFPTLAGTPAAAEENPACEALSSDYEDLSKDMGAIFAEGASDGSAIRATLREMQKGNNLTRASLLIDLMKGKGCTLPDKAPSGGKYVLPALKCANAQLAGDTSASKAACDRKQWKPLEASQ